ncbi:unnamed protein product [Ectocarpus sp. CCAP 1310/34]|nr:unnamed protein product [Ectocarpus sp. CCAP 1310/34]
MVEFYKKHWAALLVTSTSRRPTTCTTRARQVRMYKQEARQENGDLAGSLGLPDEGIINSEEFLAKVDAKERADKAEAEAKAERSRERARKKEEAAAAAAARARQAKHEGLRTGRVPGAQRGREGRGEGGRD